MPRTAKKQTVDPVEDALPVKPLVDLVKFGGRNDARLLLAPPAVTKVDRSALSFSTSDAMSGCSARWVIERLLPRSHDPFGAAELGTSGHRVFELIFALPPEERTTARAMEIVASLQDDADGQVSKPADPADLDRWHGGVTKMVTGLWSIENPREIDVVGLELKMENIEVAGVPFIGYIDRLRRIADGTVVGDFKTGKIGNKRYGDKHGDQTRVYSEALNQMPDYERPVGGEILYTQYEERHEVDFSQGAMDRTLEKFASSWATLRKQVDGAEFNTKVGPLCGWCPAVDVCPAAKAAGKVAKVEFVISGTDLGIGESTTTSVAITAKPVESPADLAGEPGQVSTTRGMDDSTATTKEVTTMSEPKPWEETNDDGSLNYNSYGATAAFGIVSLAVETLSTNGADITAANVTAFSTTLTKIIDDVYVRFYDGQTPSFAAGLHTRLRGAIRTALETIPAPFGGDNEAWDQWVHRATVRTFAIAKTATALWERGDTPERPWSIFAVDGVKDIPVDDFADA